MDIAVENTLLLFNIFELLELRLNIARVVGSLLNES
jgi:hypothetical protein